MNLKFWERWGDQKGSEEASGGGVFNSADYDMMARAFNQFTGATIPGTLDLPAPWSLDYYALRERSWQAYTENEHAAALIDRLRHFVINCGLKMQYEPSKILESWGYEISEETQKFIGREFNLYASSKSASYDGRRDLHKMADEAYLNVLNAGDLLVILHVDKDTKDIQVQHVDGKNLVQPWERSQLLRAGGKGNLIVNGVEYDRRGREVAYYIQQDNFFAASLTGNFDNRFKTTRVPAYGTSGRRIAFRPARDNQRIGGGRGKPLLTAMLQKMAIAHRYEIAELTAAEVNAAFVATIEHDENSSGENPYQLLPNGGGRHSNGQAQELHKAGYSDLDGDKIAGKITNSTPGMVTNLGRGQRLKSHDTKRPNIKGAEFLQKARIGTCAAAGVPQEVADMLFTASYSASRAALEMLKIIIRFERKNFTDDYYSIIAAERLRMKALTGAIPGMPKAYRDAIIKRDVLKMRAFEGFTFTGVVVPHVDPVKEVDAAIKRISFGLSTWDSESEALGTGDFESNAERLKKERDILDSNGLEDMVFETTGEEDGTNQAQSEEADDGEDSGAEEKGSGQGDTEKESVDEEGNS